MRRKLLHRHRALASIARAAQALRVCVAVRATSAKRDDVVQLWRVRFISAALLSWRLTTTSTTHPAVTAKHSQRVNSLGVSAALRQQFGASLFVLVPLQAARLGLRLGLVALIAYHLAIALVIAAASSLGGDVVNRPTAWRHMPAPQARLTQASVSGQHAIAQLLPFPAIAALS